MTLPQSLTHYTLTFLFWGFMHYLLIGTCLIDCSHLVLTTKWRDYWLIFCPLAVWWVKVPGNDWAKNKECSSWSRDGQDAHSWGMGGNSRSETQNSFRIQVCSSKCTNKNRRTIAYGKPQKYLVLNFCLMDESMNLFFFLLMVISTTLFIMFLFNYCRQLNFNIFPNIWPHIIRLFKWWCLCCIWFHNLILPCEFDILFLFLRNMCINNTLILCFPSYWS